MSLLRQIQEGCISPQSDLATLLRMMRVLAERLQSEELRTWTRSELDGWPAGVELPEYRVLQTEVRGTFVNLAYRHTNRQIPWIKDLDRRYETLRELQVNQGVAALQELVSMALASKTRALQSPWPSWAITHWNLDARLDGDYSLESAWRVITAAQLRQVLDTIRNRALEFALAIEALNPSAGEALPGVTPIEREKVSQIFNITINGGNNNLAAGSSEVSQSLTVQLASIASGDPNSLRRFLLDQGLPETAAAEAAEIVKTEAPTPTGLGPRARAWLTQVPGRLGSASWEMAKNVTVELLAAALKKAYGLEP